MINDLVQFFPYIIREKEQEDCYIYCYYISKRMGDKIKNPEVVIQFIKHKDKNDISFPEIVSGMK